MVEELCNCIRRTEVWILPIADISVRHDVLIAYCLLLVNGLILHNCETTTRFLSTKGQYAYREKHHSTTITMPVGQSRAKRILNNSCCVNHELLGLLYIYLSRRGFLICFRLKSWTFVVLYHVLPSLQIKARKTNAQSSEQSINNLLHESKEIINDILQTEQQSRQRGDEWIQRSQ